VSATDKQGKTAIDRAEASKQDRIADLLGEVPAP